MILVFTDLSKYLDPIVKKQWCYKKEAFEKYFTESGQNQKKSVQNLVKYIDNYEKNRLSSLTKAKLF